MIYSRSAVRFVLSLAAGLILLLQFQPLSRAATVVPPFTDISRSYAKDAILRLHKLKLIDGTGNRRFEPARPVTRAEFITMIDRLLDDKPVDSAIPSYSDVPSTAWHYKWVQAAVQMGFAVGTTPTRFEPDRPVTRQDAAVMITLAAKQSPGSAPSGKPVYQDQGLISPSALPAVLQLKKLGIMQGDGKTFRPGASVTRQEAAIFMDRMWQRSGWSGQIRAAAKMKIQLGWQYGQTTEQYEKQVLQSNVNTLSPRWFFLDKTGFTVKNFDASLVTWAHENGRKVWAMAGNRSDQAITHRMLIDEKLRNEAVLTLFNEVKDRKIDGLNLDFENVAPEDREPLNLFVSELAKKLHTLHAVLSVDVSPDTHSDWTDAYDYATLGQSADYIVLMGYDEHWGGGSVAGSVSSLPWLSKGVDGLLAKMPARKVIMAMPLYTRDWTIAADKTTSQDWTLVNQNQTVRTLSLKPEWNAGIGQYVSEYTNQNSLHRLWLEDGRSLASKTMLGEKRGIAGYAYWYMGSESPDVWTSMRNAMKFSGYAFK